MCNFSTFSDFRNNKKKKALNPNKLKDKKSQDKFGNPEIIGNKSTNDALRPETNLSEDRYSSSNDDGEK